MGRRAASVVPSNVWRKWLSVPAQQSQITDSTQWLIATQLGTSLGPVLALAPLLEHDLALRVDVGRVDEDEFSRGGRERLGVLGGERGASRRRRRVHVERAGSGGGR